MLYLAALQRIPDSVIEAAMLDGAGPLRRVRYIIWPGVRYMTLLVAIVALLAFTNGSFDLVNILTDGQPIYATQTLIYYIYYTGVHVRDLGLCGRAVGAADRADRQACWLLLRLLSRLVQAGMIARRSSRIHRLGSCLPRSSGCSSRLRLIYIVLGSLMSDAQPRAIHTAVHSQLAALRQLRGRASGPTQVIDARSFLNSVIFTVGAVALQWAALHQRWPGDREDALPRATA